MERMSHLFQYEFRSALVWSKNRPFFKSHSIPDKSPEENTSSGVTGFLFLRGLGLGICSLHGPSGVGSLLVTRSVLSPRTPCHLLLILVFILPQTSL